MTTVRHIALLISLIVPALAARAQEATPPKEPDPPAATAATEPEAEAEAEPDAAVSESFPYEVEAGFRILSVSGNEDMYRTQINERSGFIIRSFTMLTGDLGGTSRLFDRLRVDAGDLGAGPAGSVRIEADKHDVYRFRLGYRHVDAFSALPAFANPLLDQGIIPGQHTYDRTRNSLDADLELMSFRNVTPFVGLSLHRVNGPGTTTYTIGGDDFRLSQDLNEREQEIRLGSAFNFGWLSGSATQGWRRAQSSQSLTLAAEDGQGNVANPILGRPVLATALTRDDNTEVSTPFTSVFLNGSPRTRVRVSANYVRFAADSSGDLTENVEGSFVSFALGRFFNGLTDTASSNAKNTTWRGGGRAEVSLTDFIVAFAGIETEHRDLQGTALINSLYRQTLTFGGVDPRDVAAILNANSSIARDEDVASFGVSARAIGPFALRAEYREAQQDLSVAPDLSEIVVPGSQGGDFERRVRTIDTHASFAKAGFTLGAAYRRDSAGAPIFRTDFRDRDRLRVRAAWTGNKWVQAGVTAEETRMKNDQTGIDLDGEARQYSGDFEVTPHEGVAFRGSVSRFRADNSILIRRPENFVIEPTVYAENGRSHEAGVAVHFAPLSFDVSGARFSNSGTAAFDIDRIRVRVGYDLPAKTKTGLVVEFAEDDYREAGASYADFSAKRMGLFIRYRP
jgi:hypothetical protein